MYIFVLYPSSIYFEDLKQRSRTVYIMHALRTLCIVTIVMSRFLATRSWPTIAHMARAVTWFWPQVTWSWRALERVTLGRKITIKKNSLRMLSSQPVKTTFKIDYTRLPWIAGSLCNDMISNCPTTSQETFNAGYNKQIHTQVPVNGWNYNPHVITL